MLRVCGLKVCRLPVGHFCVILFVCLFVCLSFVVVVVVCLFFSD